MLNDLFKARSGLGYVKLLFAWSHSLTHVSQSFSSWSPSIIKTSRQAK